MAQIANPRKQFQFSINLFGLNPFLAQEVTLPDTEIDVVEHGDTNHSIKTGGRKKYGTLQIKKISTANGPDSWVWNWIHSIQNEFQGGGQIPQIYKLNCDVCQLGTDGVTIINRWQFEGVWPSKVNGVELNRNQSDNVMESIEFQIDRQLRF